MQAEIRHASGAKIVEVLFSTQVKVEEAIGFYGPVIKKAKSEKAAGVLFDLSCHVGVFSPMEVFVLVSAMEVFRNEKLRVAVLHSGSYLAENDFDSTVAANRAISMMSFKEKEKAVEWLVEGRRN